nr:hypothetical protein [Lachnospiraceae bacterium]
MIFAESNKKRNIIVFAVSFIVIVALFFTSLIITDRYNKKRHAVRLWGDEIFGDVDSEQPVSLKITPRSSTWTKAFDINNEGITEHNYQAYTYDFDIENSTGDEVSSYVYYVHFKKQVFLQSAWNGALEIHQLRDGKELISMIPDLRDYNADDYDVDTSTFDGEVLVHMMPGDRFMYIPSSHENAMEVPIEPHEGTVPGIILYVPIGEDISDSTVELEYMYHRLLRNVPLFWISIGAMFIWLIVLIIYAITSSQIKKYNERHERDNEIISE